MTDYEIVLAKKRVFKILHNNQFSLQEFFLVSTLNFFVPHKLSVKACYSRHKVNLQSSLQKLVEVKTVALYREETSVIGKFAQSVSDNETVVFHCTHAKLIRIQVLVAE